jgi:hypothetical protein
MRRIFGFVILILFGLGLWLLKPYFFLPSGTTIISWWYADTLSQCSHEPSVARANYWIPTAEQIVDLEIKMAWVMSERERTGLLVPPAGERFNGQYIGFTRKGVRHIYGNFFPSHMIDEERWTFEWSPFEKPMCVADGGRHFWGIVYNPETREIEQPKFNGRG